MKNVITKISLAIVPCLFSLNAFGAAVEVAKPIQVKPIEVKPSVTPVTPGASSIGTSGKGLDLGGLGNPASAKKATITCSQKLDASKMVTPGGPSEGTIEAANKAGVVARGNCSENPEEMQPENKAIYNEIAACGLNAGINASTPDDVRVDTLAPCLANAPANKGKMSVEEAKAVIASINAKCGWFSQKAGAQAAAAFRN